MGFCNFNINYEKIHEMSTWMETRNYIIRKCVETSKPVSKLHFWTKTHVSVSNLHCVEIACVEVTPSTMKFLNEASGFIEGDIFC